LDCIGLALVSVVILIVVFTQRSDWDADRFILSADSEGNLDPVSEKYFADNEKALLASVDTRIAAANKRITDVNNRVSSVDHKVNVQRTDFNNRAGHVDRHFATKAEFNRLDAWSRTVGPWGDGRFQPKGNYVQYGRAFHLQNHSKGNNRFGAYNERGGWYGGPNDKTQWVIT
jgi:hypothetical protein